MERFRPFLVLSLCLIHITMATDHTTNKPPPNIVLIVADDLGMGDVGCFGNHTIRTPHLDKMAAEGAKLTHAISAASVCTPSRAAFLTGRYPLRMGMVPTNIVRVNMMLASKGGIPPQELTVAELAKQKGYSTALIGKWHLGMNCQSYGDFCHHPNKQGFDYYYGLPLTNLQDFGNGNQRVTHTKIPQYDIIVGASLFVCFGSLLFFRNRGSISRVTFSLLSVVILILSFLALWIPYNLLLMNGIVMRNTDIVDQPVDIYDDLTLKLVNETTTFIEQRRKHKEPFLLVVSWIQVHTALHCGKRFQGRSNHGDYGDNVEEMDWATGQVLEALEKNGMKDNTFVYFTSDNGAHVEEKGPKGERAGGYNGIYKGGKTQGAMEGGIRVPTLAMWPGVIPKGQTINTPNSLMDVFPTVAKILQVALPSDRVIDGRNMLPLLQGKTKESTHEFMFHYCGYSVHGVRYIPRGGKNIWKAIYAAPIFEPGTQHCRFVCSCTIGIEHYDPPQLYNIAQDPSEVNLLNPEDHAEILAKIEKAKLEHEASIEPAENQFSVWNLIPYPHLQPCCDFPSCRCNDQTYHKLK